MLHAVFSETKLQRYTNILEINLLQEPTSITNLEFLSLQGVLHPLPKVTVFCALSQNYHNLFESNMCIL